MRARVRAEVLKKSWNPELNSFVQAYGSDVLDTSLLLIALLGFLPSNDPRVTGTVHAIETTLTHDGLVKRTRLRSTTACRREKARFWLVVSGWWITWRCKAGSTKRTTCSSV